MDQAPRTIRRLAVIAAATTLISAPALAAHAHGDTGPRARTAPGTPDRP